MDPFSGYRDMPHEQVNWAELAQQWMAMKEPEYGVFPAATNLHYEQNNRNLNARPPPLPMNDYRRGPPLTGLSYNDGWRPPPAISEDWRVPPAPHGPPGHFMPHPMGRFSEGSPLQQFMHQPPQQRSFFPAPPRQMGGPPAIPPLMGFNPPPPPTEDEWGFNWQPPPPRMPPPPKPAPPPQALFPSATHKPPPQPLMDQSLRYPPPQPHYSSGPPQHFYHGSNHVEEPAPVPPPPDIPMFSGISDMDDNARKKLPAWIREGLEKSEREKQKQAEKEERIRQAEEEKKKRRELAGKSRFDSDSSDEETDNDGRRDEVQTKFKEELPKLSEEEVREHAMNFIRQFMTTILTEGTDNLLKSTIADARRESVKLEAEPKLLAKSSALAALSSLGGDDDDESERSDDEEPAKTTKTEDFEFKAPIGIPRNFSKSIVERGSVSSPKVQETDEPEDKEAAVSSQRSIGIEENRHKKSRSRSRSPERKRERKRSRSQEKKKRSRSRERKRSRDRKRSRSRERKRDSRRRSRSRESRRHR